MRSTASIEGWTSKVGRGASLSTSSSSGGVIERPSPLICVEELLVNWKKDPKTDDERLWSAGLLVCGRAEEDVEEERVVGEIMASRLPDNDEARVCVERRVAGGCK